MKHISDLIIDTVFKDISLEVFIVHRLFGIEDAKNRQPTNNDNGENFEIQSTKYIDVKTIVDIIKEFCWLTGFETFVETTSGYKSEKPGKTMLITISQSRYKHNHNTWISTYCQPFSLLDYPFTEERRVQHEYVR